MIYGTQESTDYRKAIHQAKDYQKEAQKMEKQGYKVAHTVVEQPRSGCLRIIALGGIGALVFRPKNVTTVTYELVA